VISDEDAKLVTLARAARMRAYAPYSGVVAGAAVRDTDGRTYAGATVEAPGATTSALRAAVVAAAASGARAFEAAVVVGDVSDEDLVVLREFGAGVPVLVADPDGVVQDRQST
jgi:cytidine deaminase